MSPVSGWRYHKWGECPECHYALGLLHVPVLEGELCESGGREVIRGPSLPHFPPVCKECTTKFSLEVLCEKHRFPIRVEDGRCKLCPS